MRNLADEAHSTKTVSPPMYATVLGAVTASSVCLEIMMDSQICVYGALGLLLLMALKISVLSAMPAATTPIDLICRSQHKPLSALSADEDI